MDDKIYSLLLGRRLKKLFRSRFSKLRKRYGLTQLDIELLQYFEQNPGAMASDAIHDLELNKGNVSTALFGLYRDGLIDGQENDNDRRVVEYHLKEKGKKIMKEAAEIREDLMEHLFEGLSGQELEYLQIISEKVCSNLDSLLQ